jgi:hypothetical protein
MGAGQSIPTGMPSREALKSKTAPTQAVINSLFIWMLNNTDIQDLLKLADQRRCKDYIFFTKRALEKFFFELQLEPKLGNQDVLYFDSVKRLTFSDEESLKGRTDLKQYRDSLCLQIAFFYVRIIQIFGALALTVIDSLPDAEPQTADFRAAIQANPMGRRAPPPGFIGGQQGGVATEEDRSELGEFYTVAKNYFTAIPATNLYVISSRSSAAIPRDPSTTVGTLLFDPNKNKNVLYRPRADILVEASVSIENLRTGESYTLQIDNITVNGTRKDTTYNLGFKITRGGDYLYNTTNFATTIATVMGNAARGRVSEAQPDQQRRRTEGSSDDAGVVQGLSYTGIFKYLKEKPKAYCVARAIQLLSPTLIDSMRKDTPLKSSVCFYSPMPGIPDTVPNYGQVITKHSPGLRALNQLFFDMVQGNLPKISEEVKPKYKKFTELMQVIFAPPPPSRDAPDQLDKVISKPFYQCESPEVKDKEIFIKNAEAIRKVRQSIAALLSYQINHTATVMQFLPKLFVLDKAGQIKGIQPSVMKGGIPRVNQLADEARNMLSEYYKFCEGTYRLGALEILKAPGNVAMARPRSS